MQYELGSGHTELDPHVCCPPSVGVAEVTSYEKELKCEIDRIETIIKSLRYVTMEGV